MEDDIEVDPRPASARRTLMRNGAARQVAVNFMPSRQLTCNTLRIRRNNSEHNALLDDVMDAAAAGSGAGDKVDAADRQADIIVREMEQHQRLMEDSPDAEELRREALRELPEGLTMKRHVRAKLSASVSLRSKRRPLSCTKRLKYRLSFAWKRTKDRLRDMIFSIELWYEAIRNIEGHFGSAVGSYFYLVRWMFALNVALATMLVAFVVVPQALHDRHMNTTLSDHRGFLDFIGGTGWLEDSLLFYGHYHHDDTSPGRLRYHMPFAYFFTLLCVYLVMFAVLCYRTAYSYRRNFIETAGGLSHVFASKVFCGWDFGIVSHHAAALTANSIYNEFKELLSEQYKKKSSRGWCARAGRLARDALVWAALLALLGAVLYGLWLLLGLTTTIHHYHLLVSAAITAVLTVCPLVFHLAAKLESYSSRTVLYVTLGRTWLLDAATLVLLLVYWARSNEQCWETRFGQEAYRLVLMDAVISLVVLPIVEFVRALVYKLNPNTSPPEFNIAYNSLTLIYNQTVVWFGMVFAPLVVVAVVVKLLVLFYVKRECAMRACQPARKVWRAAQTQTVLYMLITLSLFVALFSLGTTFLGSESRCGAFSSYSSVVGVLTVGALRLHEREAARRVLAFLLRPGFIAFLLLFLSVSVYYVRARARAQASVVRILRRMLLLQAKDKDFLLDAIAKVSNGALLCRAQTRRVLLAYEGHHVAARLIVELTRTPAEYASTVLTFAVAYVVIRLPGAPVFVPGFDESLACK
ncbi:transmembrane channel-like protein 6 isoform X2 [Manduca sexta]|uniref:transmembrane channel-like protein 6 isoform X2 n=1 Tax=Manduca sexta TaxID=7130 RepID=UPI00188FDD0F|nr:transmembrane channel-like protein 6 isoform X2 [Manduca sexta]